MRSLANRVASTALAVLGATLIVIGVVTAGLLHLRAQRDLDRTLLAAAFGEAHPWQDERFENHHVSSPVAVRPWRADDPIVRRADQQAALALEAPLLFDRADRRILLLVVERPGSAVDASETHAHFIVVAEAPRVTLADAALPFLVTYALVAGTTLLLAAWLLWLGVRRAMAPLTRATRQLSTVQQLGSEVRLPPAGVAEVDQLLESTNALLDRLSTAFGAQASFTAQAAHELRTPVTILKGELDLALRRPRTADDYRTALTHALEQTERLAELVEGLMALARVEAGQADRERVQERLSAAVHQALVREQRVLDEAGCAVEVVAAADPELHMNVALVSTALANLLRNAARYAAGTPVQVRYGDEAGTAWVEVLDGGPGLAADDRERVLDRFQRGSTRRDGLGLGLPLAREIARRHGGDLQLLDPGRPGLLARLTLSCVSNEGPIQRQGASP